MIQRRRVLEKYKRTARELRILIIVAVKYKPISTLFEWIELLIYFQESGMAICFM